jgi:hypothetical protein
MRLIRQPTIKTLTMLIGVYAVVFAAMIANGLEAGGDLSGTWPFLFGWIPAAIVTWLIPFILALVTRSPIRVGILCIAVGCGSMAADWAGTMLDDRFHWFANASPNSSAFDDLVIMVTFAVGGTTSITNWVFDVLTDRFPGQSFAYSVEVAGICTYGLVGYFIAKTFRLRELVVADQSRICDLG